jgi:hypothetical protein
MRHITWQQHLFSVQTGSGISAWQQAADHDGFAIDTVNTPVLDQAYLRQELIKFPEQPGTMRDPILLVEITVSGIRVVHEFTTDPRSAAAAIQKLKSVHPLREGRIATNADIHPCAKEECFDGTVADDDPGKQLQPFGAGAVLATAELLQRYQSRNERLDTLYAFYQLVERLRGVPGNKALVWASSGFKIFDGFYRTGASKRIGSAERGGRKRSVQDSVSRVE